VGVEVVEVLALLVMVAEVVAVELVV